MCFSKVIAPVLGFCVISQHRGRVAFQNHAGALIGLSCVQRRCFPHTDKKENGGASGADQRCKLGTHIYKRAICKLGAALSVKQFWKLCCVVSTHSLAGSFRREVSSVGSFLSAARDLSRKRASVV